MFKVLKVLDTGNNQKLQMYADNSQILLNDVISYLIIRKGESKVFLKLFKSENEEETIEFEKVLAEINLKKQA